jgi:Tat protein translocase TatB subunit
VFGIGMQEMVIIGLIVLVVFGPKKLPTMARDFGRFVSEARRSVEEFKEDLVSEKEGGQEPREEQQGQGVGEEHQDDVKRDADAMVPRDTPRAD